MFSWTTGSWFLTFELLGVVTLLRKDAFSSSPAIMGSSPETLTLHIHHNTVTALEQLPLALTKPTEGRYSPQK